MEAYPDAFRVQPRRESPPASADPRSALRVHDLRCLAQIGSRHPHAAPKQLSKKFAFMLPCVFGSLRGALLSSFFYFDTGAYKLVDLIWDKQVTLAELSYIS
jgi:hypothetical protein